MAKKNNQSIVCILNGPPGSGKTTLALQCKKNWPGKVKVVSVDKMRRTFHKSANLDSNLGKAVLIDSTIRSAKEAAKYTSSKNKHDIIFIDDCIVEKKRMKLYQTTLGELFVIKILLWPSSSVQKTRDTKRHSSKRVGEHALKLRTKMRSSQVRQWHDIVIDNGEHTVIDTAKILKKKIQLALNKPTVR